MAAIAPEYVAKGAFASGTGALTVTMPSGIRNGDMLILIVESANQAITTPTGWTQFSQSPQSTGTAAAAGGVRLGAFYKFVNGVEASVSVADTGDHTTAIVFAVRNVNAQNPISQNVGRVDASATTSMSWSAVTTAVANEMVLLLTANDHDLAGTTGVGAVTNGNLTGITEIHDQTIASGVGGGIHAAYGFKASAGSTGSSTATGSSSVTHAYLTVGLRGKEPVSRIVGQYENDEDTVIPEGGTTNDGVSNYVGMVGEFSSAEAFDDVVAPKAELEPTGTSFDNTANITLRNRIQRSTNSTSSRRGGEMVYDDVNKRYLYFGGYDGVSNRTNELWEFYTDVPGQTWRRVTVSGTPPTGKNLFGMTIVRGNLTSGGALRMYIVIWGGANPSDVNEMHTIRIDTPGSEAWATVTQTSAPSARSYVGNHLVAGGKPASDTQYIYLYGGWAASRENALFRCTFDVDTPTAVTWTTLLATGAGGNPPQMTGCVLDYKASTSKLYLYGGYNGTTFYNTFWEYDIAGNTWTNTSPSGTAPTASEAMAGGYDAANNRFWFTGGWTTNGTFTTSLNQIGYINDVGGSESYVIARANDYNDDAYAPNCFAGNCIDPDRGLLVLRGMATYDSNERYHYAIDLNDGITTDKPVYGVAEGEDLTARDAVASVWNPDAKEWVIIGGFADQNNDTLESSGALSGTHVSSIWVYDEFENTWRYANKGFKTIPPLEGVVACYDTTRDRILMFGGLTGTDQTSNEVWSLTRDANGNYEAARLTPSGTPPSARWLGIIAYDATNDRMITGMGRDLSSLFNTMFSLSFSGGANGAWSTLSPTGTPPTAAAQPAFFNKASNTRLYVYGGYTNTGASAVSSQLLYFDYSTTNGVWTTPTSSAGTARRGMAFGYDEVNDRLVISHGSDGSATLSSTQWWNVASPGAWVTPTISGYVPDSRRSMGSMLIGGRLYMFGGRPSAAGSMWYDNTTELSVNYSTPNSTTWANKFPLKYVPMYFRTTGKSAGNQFHWQSWVTEQSQDSAKVSYPLGVGTYYFNASDAGPTDVLTSYTNDANAFNGDLTSYASQTANALIPNGLNGTGTDAPTSGGTILQVRARHFTGTNIDSPLWSEYVTLNAPSGGWTWQKVNDLEVKFGYDTGGGFDFLDAAFYHSGVSLGGVTRQVATTATEARTYRAEVEVVWSNDESAVDWQIAGGGTEVDVTKTADYDVSFDTTVQKTAQYTVPKDYDVTKTAQYAVATSLDVTKSADYDVLASFDITKSAQYTVPSTISLNKSAQYTVTINLDITKSAQYAVPTNTDVTKTADYDVLASVDITKSAQYTVPNTPADVQKTAQYTVPNAVTVQKTAQYTVITTPADITKNASYVVTFSTDVSKTADYDVTFDTTVQKTAQYIVTFSTDITKTAQYAVPASTDITKGADYLVSYNPTDITKTAVYEVSTGVEVDITKSAQYTVPKDYDVTKSAQYTVPSNVDVTKSASYVVLSFADISKPAQYTVPKDYDVTKSADYDVATDTTVQKTADYDVLATFDIQKTAQYTVPTTLDITKSASYVVEFSTTVQKSAQYTVPFDYTVQKSAQYAVISLLDISKVAQYTVTVNIDITKTAQYTVPKDYDITKSAQYYVATSTDVLKSATYVVESSQTVQKSAQYTVPSNTDVTKSADYDVLSSADITKAAQYTVPKDYEIALGAQYLVATSTDVQKTAAYVVIFDVDITKGAQYYVATSTDITKSASYVVVFSADITKQAQYTVPSEQSTNTPAQYYVATSTDVTKPASYAVQTAVDVTKSASYAVAYSQDIQKTALYLVLNFAGDIQKFATYTVPYDRDVTVPAKYEVPNSVDVTKSAQYQVPSTTSIQLNASYVVSFSTDISKSAQYAVPDDVDIQLTAAYEVTSAGDVLVPAQYTVPTDYDIQKTADYDVAIATDITKSASYVVSFSTDISKSASYVVLSSADISKVAQYTVPFDYTVQKSAQYTVPSSSDVSKGATYTVPTDHDITKSASYVVSFSTDVQKPAQYTVPNDVTVQKSAEYVVTSVGDILKSAQYTVPSEGSLDVPSDYEVASTVDIQKTSDYDVAQSTDITKQAKYEVPTSNTVSRSAEYVVGSAVTVQLSASYAVVSSLDISKVAQYTVTATFDITKGADYDVARIGEVQVTADYDVLISTDIQKIAQFEVLAVHDIAVPAQYVVLTITVVDFDIPAEYAVSALSDITKVASYTVARTTDIQKEAKYRVLSIIDTPDKVTVITIKVQDVLEIQSRNAQFVMKVTKAQNYLDLTERQVLTIKVSRKWLDISLQ